MKVKAARKINKGTSSTIKQKPKSESQPAWTVCCKKEHITRKQNERKEDDPRRIEEEFQAKIFALELLHPVVYGVYKYGAKEDGAHSVAVRNSLEGIDHNEECSVCIGGEGEERKATLKIDTIMTSPGSSCTSYPFKVDSAQSQGIAVDSENLSTAVIKKLGREMELKLKRVRLPMKGKYHSATSFDAKVSNRDVRMYRTMKTRKSILDTGDVRFPKTVDLISNKNVITEDRCFMKHSRCSKSKQSKSASVIKRNKQFGLKYDCEVKLERLSPEFLKQALSRQKKQQSVKARSVTQVHERCKTDNSFYFQKPSGTNCGTKEKTDGYLVLTEEDGSFGMQIIDDTWGNDGIDAWGNVRYLLKGHSIFSESEEDWYGWWVRVDSLHNFYDAHLYSTSDGVTESRILVWDNPFEAKPTLQNNTVQVPEQTEYVREESQHTEEEWAGWKGLCVQISLADASSISFSDEEADEFHGW